MKFSVGHDNRHALVQQPRLSVQQGVQLSCDALAIFSTDLQVTSTIPCLPVGLTRAVQMPDVTYG